ncbi:MAG: homoserine kinase [Burkholderiales bacterium]
MSVFTKVSKNELSRWLKNYSIGALTDLEGIASGIENTNYFVTTSHGRFVLTLFEKLKAAELPFYLELMAHLSSHGIPCPTPIANLQNDYLGELNGKPASVVTCLPGHSVTQPTPDDCAEVGALLADMHLAGSSFALSMPNPRGPKWWHAAAPEIAPFLNREDLTMLEAEIHFQSSHRFDELARGVIHADLFRDNILFAEGRVGGVIDFYFACSDVLLYDVAITINDWCLNEEGRINEVHAAHLLSAYHAVREFNEVEAEALPVMLRAGALRFWVSRLYDFHLPRPGELTHAKNPEHFKRILQNHLRGEARARDLFAHL